MSFNHFICNMYFAIVDSPSWWIYGQSPYGIDASRIRLFRRIVAGLKPLRCELSVNAPEQLVEYGCEHTLGKRPVHQREDRTSVHVQDEIRPLMHR